MAKSRISLELPSGRWVVGTPYPVTVRLLNDSEAAIEVPRTVSESEFEFRLVSGSEVRLLSARGRRFRRRPDPAPVPRHLRPLAPGESADYVENLAEYAQPALRPGSYQIGVRWTRGRPDSDVSATLDLQVVAPSVVSMVSAVEAPGVLAVLWADQTEPGQSVIWQREAPQRDPAGGVGAERARFVSTASPSLALSVSPADSRGVRWSGWLAGGVLGACLAQGGTVFGATEALKLSLGHPRLHPVAWPLDKTAALFAVLGDGAVGTVSLSLVTHRLDEEPVLRQISLMTGGPVTQWAVQRADDATGSLVIVTAVLAAGATRLLSHRLAANSDTAETQVLLECQESLQTLALAPVGPGTADTAYVDVIVGPTRETPPRMLFMRLPLAGGAPMLALPISIPRDAGGAPATDWTLAPAINDMPRLLARMGGQILSKTIAAGAGGGTLDRDAAMASGFRLEVVGDDWWALWIDPRVGVRTVKLR